MLHTLLIALAVVGGTAAIIFLCIFIARRESKRKKQRLLESYAALLAQHNINPDFSQTFEHRMFAFDANLRMFAFVQNDKILPSGVVDLSEVSECRIWKNGVQVSFNSSRNQSVEEHISSVGLLFRHKNGNELIVPVYTEVLDGIEEKIKLSKAAEHWLSRITTAMSGKANGRQAVATSG